MFNSSIRIASPSIGLREYIAVGKVLRSGNLSSGVQVQFFEKNFSKYFDNLECVAVNSGTSALFLSLIASGIGPGDEIIVPTFTFAATANVVTLVGAKPVFVDIEEDSFNIDPKLIEAKISTKTKGVIAVHLYGNPAELDLIKNICDKHDLLLFEDAAQAHGAQFRGKKVGTWGISNSFSFYPTKNMTTGEGGLIVTSNAKIVQKIKLLRNQGMLEQYKNEIAGYNLRMSDIHAAIGNIQFSKLELFTERRIRNAHFYSDNLENIITPKNRPYSKHVFHQYTIRIPHLDRNFILTKLRKNGIQCGIYYPTPVHKLITFQTDDNLPVAEKISKECFSIPVHPKLKKSQLAKIVKTLNLIASGKI